MVITQYIMNNTTTMSTIILSLVGVSKCFFESTKDRVFLKFAIYCTVSAVQYTILLWKMKMNKAITNVSLLLCSGNSMS